MLNKFVLNFYTHTILLMRRPRTRYYCLCVGHVLTTTASATATYSLLLPLRRPRTHYYCLCVGDVLTTTASASARYSRILPLRWPRNTSACMHVPLYIESIYTGYFNILGVGGNILIHSPPVVLKMCTNCKFNTNVKVSTLLGRQRYINKIIQDLRACSLACYKTKECSVFSGLLQD